MKFLIKNYVDKLSKNDINTFLINNDIYLDENELSFSYNFIKENWDKIVSSPNMVNLDSYKTHFKEENYLKICDLYKTYYTKYHRYL